MAESAAAAGINAEVPGVGAQSALDAASGDILGSAITQTPLSIRNMAADIIGSEIGNFAAEPINKETAQIQEQEAQVRAENAQVKSNDVAQRRALEQETSPKITTGRFLKGYDNYLRKNNPQAKTRTSSPRSGVRATSQSSLNSGASAKTPSLVSTPTPPSNARNLSLLGMFGAMGNQPSVAPTAKQNSPNNLIDGLTPAAYKELSAEGMLPMGPMPTENDTFLGQMTSGERWMESTGKYIKDNGIVQKLQNSDDPVQELLAPGAEGLTWAAKSLSYAKLAMAFADTVDAQPGMGLYEGVKAFGGVGASEVGAFAGGAIVGTAAAFFVPAEVAVIGIASVSGSVAGGAYAFSKWDNYISNEEPQINEMQADAQSNVRSFGMGW